MLQLPLNLSLDQAANFDNYFVGNNQQLVQKLNKLTAHSDQFLFIYASSGCGKTHLAQATSLAVDQAGLRVVYLPLSNEMIAPQMLDGLEQFETIVIDDVDLICKNEDWQVALFNLYNAIRDRGHNLVVFAQQPIDDLAIELADLVSRFRAMEIYRLEGISSQQSEAFLLWRANKMGLQLSQEVAVFMLSRISRTPNSVVNALQQLDKASLAQQRKLTIPFVKSVLSL